MGGDGQVSVYLPTIDGARPFTKLRLVCGMPANGDGMEAMSELMKPMPELMLMRLSELNGDPTANRVVMWLVATLHGGLPRSVKSSQLGGASYRPNK